MSELDPSGLSDAELRRQLSALVAEYSARLQQARDNGDPRRAEPLDRATVTPTDVIVTVRRMLDTFDIAAFELGMMG